MSRQSIIVFLLLFCISRCKGAISDKRLCGDPTCSGPVSYAKTLIRYVSDDERILSFQANVKATVFSKSAGSRPDLWGVEIDGKRGYAPQGFLREYQIVTGMLKHVVSTKDDDAPNIVNTLPKDIEQQTGTTFDTREVPPSEDSTTLPTSSNADNAEVAKEDIPPSSETIEPYEVADGTTIYYNTDMSTESLLIKATTIDSNIKPTVHSQPDLKTSDIDTPNPSLVLPEATTSSDVIAEKDESEGSTREKIYKYLISNFMSDEASGEPPTENAALSQSDEKEEGSQSSDSHESSQKDFIESNDSSDILHSSEAVTKLKISPVKGNDSPDQRLSPPTRDTGIVKKSASNEDLERGDEDEEKEDDDEADVESNEDTPDSDQLSIDSHQASPVTPLPVEIDDSSIVVLNEDKLEDRDFSTKKLPFHVEMKSQKEMHKHMKTEVSSPSELLHNNLDDSSEVQNLKTEFHSTMPVLGSDNINGNHLEVSVNKENKDEYSDNALTESNHTLVSDNNIVPDNLNQLQDLAGGQHTETVLPSLKEASDSTVNPTLSPLSETENPDNLMTDQSTPPSQNAQGVQNHHPVSETNIRETDIGLGSDKDAPEEDPVNVSPDSLQQINLAISDETSGLQFSAVEPENSVDATFAELSVNETVVDEVKGGSVDTLNVDTPNVDALGEATESNVIVSEEAEKVDDFFKSESFLTTGSPEDYSTNSYIDDMIEDSPQSVLTDSSPIDTEDVSNVSTGDNPEVSEGFFSGVIGSLFGGYFSSNYNEGIESSLKKIDSDDGNEDDDGARNSVWSAVHSYGKPADVATNHQPETASSCLADSGLGPDCDKLLLPGNIPRVASDNEAVHQQIIPDQDTSTASRMESWEYGSTSGLLSYFGIITAVSTVVVILGHWFIEKMRCDSSFIKKINELERALLYAELESKNLKIDLEENQMKTIEVEDSERMAFLEQQLQAALETHGSLEEKNAALEEKNVSLQSSLDSATEAGLELNRMLSEILSTNKGSESLIGSVNDLQQQLNSQQATIINMKTVLTSKETESEGLHNNITLLQGTIQNLEQELNQMTETLNDLLVEKATQEKQFKCVKDELLTKLKEKSENEDELSKEVLTLCNNILKMESESCTRDMEIVLLRDCIRRLMEDTNCEESEIFKQLYDVAKANALSHKLLEEKKHLMDELAGEKDARQLLEGHVQVITNEVEALKKAVEQSEKEKVEAVTKHAVLADYFKDKETQLHKELGYRDALYMKTKGDATSTYEEVKSLQEQIENYKSQIDTLKKEISDQDRGLKSQILAFEKKSHENWLAARQAERKLQESKLEAGLLRNRLTMVEKNATNLQNEKAPTDVSIDRDPLDTNTGSSASPPLYLLDMNANMGDANASHFAPRMQPVASSGAPPYGLLSPINQMADEPLYRNRSNHASPALPRSQPVQRPMPPRKSPANPSDITFTADEARDPHSPFYGMLGPSAPYEPFHGRPIQDRHNPDLYHIPLLPYIPGTTPLILPPPVLSNVAASHDRRPPPLGRMSSPPVDRRSPPLLHHYMDSPVRVHSSPFNYASPTMVRRMTPPDKTHRFSSVYSPHGHRYTSPDRGRRSSPLRGRASPSPPRGRTTPSRYHGSNSVERERRRSVGSTGRDSPLDQPSSHERGRRRSLTPRGPLDHSVAHKRTSSPEHKRPYRRRSRSPSGRYSDSSPDSASDSRPYARRYDYSPESSYRGRSRTPSPTGFRPISREPSNNQGSNRSSNQSYESDESNRRSGRL